MRSASGFTLLEVLIAVAITAMIGVGATQLLSSIVNTRQSTDIRAEQLASLQRFNSVVSRDMEQIINRPIRDEFGDHQEALVLDGKDYLLEFTRAGWRNSPLAVDPRSELQRVAYRLELMDSDACTVARETLLRWGVDTPRGQCLVRYFWPVLDRANTSLPQQQMLLEQVDQLNIELLSGALREHNSEAAEAFPEQDWFITWPVMQGSGGTPMAIRWQLELPQLGRIERLFLLVWGTF